MFFSQYLSFPLSYHSTNAAYSSSSEYYFVEEGKWAKPGNLRSLDSPLFFMFQPVELFKSVHYMTLVELTHTRSMLVSLISTRCTSVIWAELLLPSVYHLSSNRRQHVHQKSWYRFRNIGGVITQNTTIQIIDHSQFLNEFAKLRKATVTFVMSVRLSAWNNSTATRRIFMKFDISVFFENLFRKFKFH
jgi:hypothetical protein